MHEMSLMTQIFDIINDAIASHEVTEVTRITLKVGKMSNVVPDSLSFCFEVLAKGTKCEGAELVIKEILITAYCANCQREFVSEEFPLKCPQCGGHNTRISGGTELAIDSLDVD